MNLSQALQHLPISSSVYVVYAIQQQRNHVVSRNVNSLYGVVKSQQLMADDEAHLNQLFNSEASAWCGLGCALVAEDPAMSQHTFCRAMQIDSSSADSWSNVGLILMYPNHGAEKSSEILGHLA